MIDAQSLAVDSITGATGSSAGIKGAVRDALQQALVAGGGNVSDVEAFYKPVIKTEETVVLDGFDIIVVGAGQAGVSALIAAQDANPNASIISIEKKREMGRQSGRPSSVQRRIDR